MKNIKYIKNLLFCIDGEITYEELFTEKYNNLFYLHMCCDYKDYYNKHKKYVMKEIENHNNFEKLI